MIDELDLKIIKQLEEDGRRSYVEIGKKFGVAEGTVRKRVNDLIKNDVIRIHASLYPQAFGLNVVAIMGMQVQMSALRHVAQTLISKPNLRYLAFVTGRYDLMAVIITHTTEELSQFIEKEISQIPNIMRTETFVNLEVIKGMWSGEDISPLVKNLEAFKPHKMRKKS